MRSFRDIPIRQKLMIITMLTTTAALAISGIGVLFGLHPAARLSARRTFRAGAHIAEQ